MRIWMKFEWVSRASMSDDDSTIINPQDEDDSTIIRPARPDDSTIIQPPDHSTIINDPDATMVHDPGATVAGEKPTFSTGTIDPTIPQYIGPYEILGVLGEGGMGKVYDAFDAPLDRKTAVKVMSADRYPPSVRADLAKRQIQEAQLAASVSSPNLVGVFAAGQDGGQPYIAMEFVTGRALDGVLENEGTASTAHAISYMQQSAWGLNALHQKGIIHRDIKPANILVDDNGLVKVTDFGLAQPIDPEAGGTTDMMVVGTIPYLPPEQLAAESVDLRADIYALGVTMFELLTGKKPFESRRLPDLKEELSNFDLDAALNAESDIDPKLRPIIRKMMAPDREDRYPDCEELIEDLDNCRRALKLEDQRPMEARIGQTVVVQVVSRVVAIALNIVIAASFFFAVSDSGQDEGFGVVSGFWHGLRDFPYRYTPEYPAERNADLMVVNFQEWDANKTAELGQLVEEIQGLDPAAIVLDILMDESSSLDDLPSLASSYTKASNLIVASEIVGGQAVPPIPELLDTGLTTGSAMQEPDWDLLIRRTQLHQELADGETIPSLAYRAAEAYYEYHGLEMPDFGDEVLVNYSPMDDLYTFKDMLPSIIVPNIKSGFFNSDNYAGKVFLIGSSATVEDVHEYPLFGEMANKPGMWLQAVIIDNLINNQTLRPLSFFPLICGTIGMMGMAFAIGWFAPYYWLPTNWCVMLAAHMGIGAWLMTQAILIPGLPLILALLLAGAAGTGAKFWRTQSA